MEKIVQLNSSHRDQIVQIDFESEHQGDVEQKITKADMVNQTLERFKNKQELFFGYENGNELVGYVTLKPFFPGYKNCEVYWLAVKKKNHGRGTGRELMQFIEKYAKNMGFRRVCLYTGKDLLKTRKFYEKAGYRFINEFPEYYGYESGNTTAVLYVKDI